MDSIAALKTAVYARLTGSSELAALFGGSVRVNNVWPEPDTEMPYIVYRARSTPFVGLDIMGVATLTIDLWDFSEANGERMSQIRALVCNLLDGAMLDTEDGHFRIRKAFDNEMPEDTRYVYHITSEWVVRYTREKEAAYAAD